MTQPEQEEEEEEQEEEGVHQSWIQLMGWNQQLKKRALSQKG